MDDETCFPQPVTLVIDDDVIGAASSSAMTTSATSHASQHAVSESKARQIRKLAAALRQPPHPQALDVNATDEAALMRNLMAIRKFPRVVAQRIVQLRPFESRTDLVTRINAGIPAKQHRLGPAFIPMLRIEGAHASASLGNFPCNSSPARACSGDTDNAADFQPRPCGRPALTGEAKVAALEKAKNDRRHWAEVRDYVICDGAARAYR